MELNTIKNENYGNRPRGTSFYESTTCRLSSISESRESNSGTVKVTEFGAQISNQGN